MLWKSALQACLQACSKVPSPVSLLLAHRQLVYNHAVEELKEEFYSLISVAAFRFLMCQIKANYIIVPGLALVFGSPSICNNLKNSI